MLIFLREWYIVYHLEVVSIGCVIALAVVSLGVESFFNSVSFTCDLCSCFVICIYIYLEIDHIESIQL